jgi:hypothetical protein
MEPVQTDDRIPCPDDMCTGVLGPDGACGTCGRRGDPDSVARARAAASTSESEHSDDLSGEDRDAAAAALSGDSSSASTSGDDEERRPCADEMCTGILDASGRCGTCGRMGD